LESKFAGLQAVTLVEHFATWCAPCRKSLTWPAVEALRARQVGGRRRDGRRSRDRGVREGKGLLFPSQSEVS
jgi:hypothetical protein